MLGRQRKEDGRARSAQGTAEARRSAKVPEIVIMTHNPGRCTWILIAAAFVSALGAVKKIS